MQAQASVKTLDLISRYRTVRQRSVGVSAPLSVEDHAIQSMPDASPIKWHLAHTTWFFETFVLVPLGQPRHDDRFGFLFNSYYDAVGPRVDRARRGMMSRPSLEDALAYRAAVDDRLARALDEHALDGPAQVAIAATIELGLHHEQQHQELMLTDLKHALGTQPLDPAYRDDLARDASGAIAPLDWVELEGGIVEIGAGDRGFAFDNERPRHRAIVEPYVLATRPIANAEVLAFIGDDGYDEPRFWLADGFAAAQREGWRAPLYWQHRDGEWLHYDFTGLREIDPSETACHLSYFEADAIARWAGARLPTEVEWEHAATGLRARDGHWADDDRLHPRAATQPGLAQLFGDVWEWTASAYAAYPGFRPLPGALGEYNSKFMASQMVLRGGSCLTPRGHVRASYRNFFAPTARWQMTGVRLANDRGK
ncbi:MAG: ergothioneine biosynthesis protein EgtB [Deltaproteobacteria bacterium]|nr:ergothioneine biosynthesis protein EgtB [Deltaproteobacteria bacterium]